MTHSYLRSSNFASVRTLTGNKVKKSLLHMYLVALTGGNVLIGEKSEST